MSYQLTVVAGLQHDRMPRTVFTIRVIRNQLPKTTGNVVTLAHIVVLSVVSNSPVRKTDSLLSLIYAGMGIAVSG